MKIEIDDDFADDLIGASIVETYVDIKQMLKEAKKNKDSWHEDDVASWKELLPALEIVGNWYCFDFKGKVKQREKDGI